MAFGPKSRTTTTTTAGRNFLHICALLVVIISEIIASEDHHEVYGSSRLIDDFLEHNNVVLNRTLRQASRVECGSHKRRTFRRGSLDRIAGGYQANEAEFPSYVQVIVEFGNLAVGCGGTILSEWLVITAAHCFDTRGQARRTFKIIAGSTRFNKGTLYRGKSVCLPSSPGDVINDYAVVIMDRPFQFNELVQPACLPWFDLDFRTQAHIVGFGRISNRPRRDPDRLQVLPVRRHQPCTAFFSGPNAICFLANNPKYSGDACQGKQIFLSC